MEKNSVCVNNHFLYDILYILTRQCIILPYGQFLSAINAYYYYYYYVIPSGIYAVSHKAFKNIHRTYGQAIHSKEPVNTLKR